MVRRSRNQIVLVVPFDDEDYNQDEDVAEMFKGDLRSVITPLESSLSVGSADRLIAVFG
jgi:hypothetical protein